MAFFITVHNCTKWDFRVKNVPIWLWYKSDHTQCFVYTGDRLSDEDVDQLFQGMEDSQGNINYEGRIPCLINISHSGMFIEHGD